MGSAAGAGGVALAAVAWFALAGGTVLADMTPEGFRAACTAKAGAAGDAMTVEGRDGWLFLRNELRHIGVGPFWGPAAVSAGTASREDRRDPLPAVVDFKAGLEKAGIELIVVPVPCKALVYPEKIVDGVALSDKGVPPRLDETHQAFLKALREAGVNAVDLWPRLADARATGAEPLYCHTDTHWSGRACMLAAKAIADDLKTRPWYAAAAKTDYRAEERSVSITGDLVVGLPEGRRPAAEPLSLRYVGAGPALTPVAPDAASPVLLLADSHGLVFHDGGDMHAVGAGFFDQLAFELKLAPDLVAVRGSAATPARMNVYRKAKADPAYAGSKKVVIWLFTAREFTEASSGWAILPALPAP